MVAEVVVLIWHFMEEFYIPFIGISLSSMCILLIVISLSLSILRVLLSIGGGAGSRLARTVRKEGSKK